VAGHRLRSLPDRPLQLLESRPAVGKQKSQRPSSWLLSLATLGATSPSHAYEVSCRVRPKGVGLFPRYWRGRFTPNPGSPVPHQRWGFGLAACSVCWPSVACRLPYVKQWQTPGSWKPSTAACPIGEWGSCVGIPLTGMHAMPTPDSGSTLWPRGTEGSATSRSRHDRRRVAERLSRVWVLVLLLLLSEHLLSAQADVG
jgi:hypothetical protein